MSFKGTTTKRFHEVSAHQLRPAQRVGIIVNNMRILNRYKSLGEADVEAILCASGKDLQTVSKLLFTHGVKELSYEPVALTLEVVEEYVRTGQFNESKGFEASQGCVRQAHKIRPMAIEFALSAADAVVPPVIAAVYRASDIIEHMDILNREGALADPKVKAIISRNIAKCLPIRPNKTYDRH